MRGTRCGKAAACLTTLTLALGGLSFLRVRAAAQGPDSSGGVELRPGLLVHPTLNVAYVMTPEGVAAVELATGNKPWTSNAAAKPLALSGNLLVSQAEPRAARNRLELVVLDVRRGGAPAVRGAAELPPDVTASVGETLAGKFFLEARPAADSVLLDWSFQPVEVRGMIDESEDPERMGGGERVLRAQGQAERTAGGGLRMSLGTGAVTRQEGAQLSQAQPRARPNVLLSPRTASPGDREARFESADGRHELVSERVADDSVWDKYRWTVYERGTGRRLGEFRTHLSFNPFVVRDSTVIFETTPFVLRGSPPEPAKLRAYSLGDGREAWSVEVREIVYRGPYPP